MDQDKLLKIVKTWKIRWTPEYRGFRCAKCQKYLQKAWHVWLDKGGFKLEVHFCKECGDKLRLNKKIKGLIYDLDGTIIFTQELHKAAWIFAGKKFNISISKEMLLNQSGISNKAAALMMLPHNKKYLLDEFIKTKEKYVMSHLKKIAFFPDVLRVIRELIKRKYSVYICTSAQKIFVKKVLNISKSLGKFKNNIIWREMYKREKPFPDALNLTVSKMNLPKSQILYIGDAFNDYQTSIAARVRFVYFCPDIRKRDLRIPKSIPIISHHQDIFKLI